MAKVESGHLLHGLPGHPVHPPLTDVTIGAFTFGTLAAILSRAGVAPHGFAAAWWLALVVGACSAVPTAATGLLDWLTITRGSELWKTATVHALAMITSTVLVVLAIVFGHHGYAYGDVPTAALVPTVCGFATLVVGGWLGGAITYVHGMRVLGLSDEPAVRAVAPVPHEEKVKAAS